MLKELRDILDSRIPDTDKLKAVTSLVESCYTQQEYKDLLYSSMGTPKQFGKIIEGLSVDALWDLIESSELDPSDYAHLGGESEPNEFIEFINAHRDYMNFDFGGHFGTRTDIGGAVYAMCKKDATGKMIEGRPSATFNVGGNMVQAFKGFEVVYVAGSPLQARQQVAVEWNGIQVKGKTVRQPNPFQWAVEFQHDNKRVVEFFEIREITPIVHQ